MTSRASKSGKAGSAGAAERRLREINGALLASSVRQHELTEEAEGAAAALRLSQSQLRALTAALTKEKRRLRELVKELSRAETRERKLLATELHDNLAQLLAVCKMKVSAIEASAPPGTPTAREARAVKDFLGQGIDYTRTLMSDLRPDALNEHDLSAAMQWVAQRMRRHGVAVRVEDDGEPKPLKEELLALVFNSVRELLFNVVKHARTGKATVSLRRADGEVRVTVSDAGVGFDPGRRAAPSEPGGFGLFSIGERLDLVGGKMEVESAPGRGTSVRLIVPGPLRREGKRPASGRNGRKTQ